MNLRVRMFAKSAVMKTCYLNKKFSKFVFVVRNDCYNAWQKYSLDKKL